MPDYGGRALLWISDAEGLLPAAPFQRFGAPEWILLPPEGEVVIDLTLAPAPDGAQAAARRVF